MAITLTKTFCVHQPSSSSFSNLFLLLFHFFYYFIYLIVLRIVYNKTRLIICRYNNIKWNIFVQFILHCSSFHFCFFFLLHFYLNVRHNFVGWENCVTFRCVYLHIIIITITSHEYAREYRKTNINKLVVIFLCSFMYPSIEGTYWSQTEEKKNTKTKYWIAFYNVF